MPAGLDGLRAERDRQRALTGFGALSDRQVVYLRQTGEDDDDTAIYLLEIGADGRRIRQVEVAADGTSIKTDVEDWLSIRPWSIYDPHPPGQEIYRDEFERAWATAQRHQHVGRAERRSGSKLSWRRSASSPEAGLAGLDNGLGAARDLELGEDVRDVVADGLG